MSPGPPEADRGQPSKLFLYALLVLAVTMCSSAGTVFLLMPQVPPFLRASWRLYAQTLIQLAPFAHQYRKFSRKKDAINLFEALKERIKISIDWKGKDYCGLHLKWDYNEQTLQVSIPGYIKKVLIKFKHPRPERDVDLPRKFNSPAFGNENQPIEIEDKTLLGEKEKKFIQ